MAEIKVKVMIDLECQVIQERGSGAYLLTFPKFPEMKPIAYAEGFNPQALALEALEKAIYERIERGQIIPAVRAIYGKTQKAA